MDGKEKLSTLGTSEDVAGLQGADGGIQEYFTVEVRCSRETFRRAAIVFSYGKQTVDVSPAQLARLQAEPCLTVRVLSASGDDKNGVAGVVLSAADAPHGDLNARIRDAIAGLNKDNPDHYAQSGKPKVGAVSEALGVKVSQSDIEAALKQDA